MDSLNIYGPPLKNVTASKNFYQLYQSTKTYIDSLEGIIDSLQKELDTLIRKSGPVSVRAIVYDSMPGVSIKVSDEKVLSRISELKVAIDINKTNLSEWQTKLEEQKKSIIKKSKQLDDLNLKVFIAAWMEGKKNEEISHELGYSLSHIWHAKVEINKMLNSVS